MTQKCTLDKAYALVCSHNIGMIGRCAFIGNFKHLSYTSTCNKVKQIILWGRLIGSYTAPGMSLAQWSLKQLEHILYISRLR